MKQWILTVVHSVCILFLAGVLWRTLGDIEALKNEQEAAYKNDCRLTARTARTQLEVDCLRRAGELTARAGLFNTWGIEDLQKHLSVQKNVEVGDPNNMVIIGWRDVRDPNAILYLRDRHIFDSNGREL